MMVSFPIIKCQVLTCLDFAEYWMQVIHSVKGENYAVTIYVCEEHFKKLLPLFPHSEKLTEEDFKNHKLVRYIRGS